MANLRAVSRSVNKKKSNPDDAGDGYYYDYDIYKGEDGKWHKKKIKRKKRYESPESRKKRWDKAIASDKRKKRMLKHMRLKRD